MPNCICCTFVQICTVCLCQMHSKTLACTEPRGWIFCNPVVRGLNASLSKYLVTKPFGKKHSKKSSRALKQQLNFHKKFFEFEQEHQSYIWKTGNGCGIAITRIAVCAGDLIRNSLVEWLTLCGPLFFLRERQARKNGFHFALHSCNFCHSQSKQKGRKNIVLNWICTFSLKTTSLIYRPSSWNNSCQFASKGVAEKRSHQPLFSPVHGYLYIKLFEAQLSINPERMFCVPEGHVAAPSLAGCIMFSVISLLLLHLVLSPAVLLGPEILARSGLFSLFCAKKDSGKRKVFWSNLWEAEGDCFQYPSAGQPHFLCGFSFSGEANNFRNHTSNARCVSSRKVCTW